MLLSGHVFLSVIELSWYKSMSHACSRAASRAMVPLLPTMVTQTQTTSSETVEVRTEQLSPWQVGKQVMTMIRMTLLETTGELHMMLGVDRLRKDV